MCMLCTNTTPFLYKRPQNLRTYILDGFTIKHGQLLLLLEIIHVNSVPFRMTGPTDEISGLFPL